MTSWWPGKSLTRFLDRQYLLSLATFDFKDNWRRRSTENLLEFEDPLAIFDLVEAS